MYFQEDTILRMIEQLGAFYRQLMRLMDDHRAQDELDEMMRRLTGLDRSTAKGLSVLTLTDMLSPDRRLALADLWLMECQRFARSMGEEGVLEQKHRAMTLLCTLDDEDYAKLRSDLVRRLFGECSELCTAEETGPVLRFLRLGGAYDQAEDVLFMQLNSYGRGEDIRALVEEGDALYSALLRLPEERLVAGNLPRAEVLEGKAALEAWRQAVGVS